MWEKAIKEDWSEKEVSFLTDELGLPNGDILDIPCGTGRIAILLAKKKYTLTCVDISEEFIKSLK
jgi:Methyltransferase small domain.